MTEVPKQQSKKWMKEFENEVLKVRATNSRHQAVRPRDRSDQEGVPDETGRDGHEDGSSVTQGEGQDQTVI